MIASGNVLPVAYGLSSFLGAKGPVIAENGGIVCYRDKVHKLNGITAPLRAFEHLKERMPEVERLFTDNWRETEIGLKRSNDLERIKAILADWPVEIEVTGFAIHIMEQGQSKLKGLMKGCELLGIEIEDVLAFGDSDNDARMLQGVGESVAVGNASPLARQAAKYISKAEHGDGVIEGLRHYGVL
jgi:hypothetical protein